MPKQIYTDNDPLAVKPIVEALIFASEEPLSARVLIKLLAGENARPSDRVPPLLRMIEEEPAPGAEPSMEDPTHEGADIMVKGSDHPRHGGITLVVDDAEDETDPIDETTPAAAEASELAEAIRQANRRTSGRSTMIDPDSLDQRYIRRIIEQLNDEYDETNRAFRIVEVAGGFQYATMREYGEYVALLSKEKSRRRLSAAALETLAIIAYRQPVSKPEIEAIRGVNCDQVLMNLMEKNLAVLTGRSEGVGRPLLYGTTDDFLRSFGLNNIADLPKLREIEELMETDVLSAESAEVVMIDQETDVEEIEAKVGAMGSMHRPEVQQPDSVAGPTVKSTDADMIAEPSTGDE